MSYFVRSVHSRCPRARWPCPERPSGKPPGPPTLSRRTSLGRWTAATFWSVLFAVSSPRSDAAAARRPSSSRPGRRLVEPRGRSPARSATVRASTFVIRPQAVSSREPTASSTRRASSRTRSSPSGMPATCVVSLANLAGSVRSGRPLPTRRFVRRSLRRRQQSDP